MTGNNASEEHLPVWVGIVVRANVDGFGRKFYSELSVPGGPYTRMRRQENQKEELGRFFNNKDLS
ncbi:hypothetical protein Golomagni_01873 [Golovinomyces magnicellulatus]|nr:hypothetical protein Golomagni_01873 [Golovinomyces magnicellulatus]